MEKELSFKLKQIGVLKTPYKDKRDAPFQPLKEEIGEFKIIVFPEYKDGLKKLNGFKYIYVLYFLDRAAKNPSLLVSPPWESIEVGLFASRSPNRINPIGLSVVKIKKIEENIIYTSAMDALDNTPLIDIKPYIKDLDTREDANYGWIDEINGKEHLILHIKGIPH